MVRPHVYLSLLCTLVCLDLVCSEIHSGSNNIQQPSLTLSTTPPPASGGGNGGFGFSFPTTPPSAVDAAVHEARAERVFSTWASSHSRSGLEGDEDGGLLGSMGLLIHG